MYHSKIPTRLMVGLVLLILSISVSANQAEYQALTSFIPKLAGISANAHILIDHHTQQALSKKNADLRLEPASMTKVMTAYVALKEMKLNPDLGNEVFISAKAYGTGGSRTFLEINTRVAFNLVLRGLMVQSGNDAAVAIAEHIAGDEQTFSDLMNEYAKKLGLVNTNFVNSSGLPAPEHYSSARDLALIASVFINEFPEFYKIYSLKSFTYNNIKQNNRNRLLWQDPSVDGMKTGHTSSAGYGLLASAIRDDMRLISVVMGAINDDQRTLQTQKLLNYGFRYFTSHLIAEATQPLQTSRVWFGNQEIVNIGVQQNWQATLPRRFADNISIRYAYNQDQLEAPLQKGQVIGHASIMLDGKAIHRSNLVSLDQVDEAGFFARLFDWISRLFSSASKTIFSS